MILLHHIEPLLKRFTICHSYHFFLGGIDPFLLQRVFRWAVHVVEDAKFAGILVGCEFVGGDFVRDVVAGFIFGGAIPFLFLNDIKRAALPWQAVIEGTRIEHDALAEGLNHAESFVTDGAFEHFFHVFHLHGVGAGDKSCASGENLFHGVDRLVDGASWVRLGLESNRARRAGLHLGQAINEVVHDDIRETDVLTSRVVQVVSSDGESVAVAAEDEHMAIRTGQTHCSGKRKRTTMNVVHAMGVHEIREAAGATDAGNGNDFLMRDLELFQNTIENGKHGEIAATGAPRWMVRSEGLLGQFVSWGWGSGSGGHFKRSLSLKLIQ